MIQEDAFDGIFSEGWGKTMKHSLSYVNGCAGSMCIHGIWYMCVCSYVHVLHYMCNVYVYVVCMHTLCTCVCSVMTACEDM